MKIEHFEDIEGWQLARELTKAVYACTTIGAFARDFGLSDQIRRAAGSVMHNIAEGFDAGSDAEFIRFLHYSQRSCTEVQSELYVALDQKYVDEQQFKSLYELAQRIHGKIGGFIKYLNASTGPSSAKRLSTSDSSSPDQGPRTNRPTTPPIPDQGPRTNRPRTSQ